MSMFFWECPSIIPYWQNLKNCMEKTLRVKFSYTLDILYLGKGNERIKNSGDKYIFRIMLVASKKSYPVNPLVLATDFKLFIFSHDYKGFNVLH